MKDKWSNNRRAVNEKSKYLISIATSHIFYRHSAYLSILSTSKGLSLLVLFFLMVSSLIFLWTMNSKSCSMILPCGNWVVLNTKFSRNRKKNLFKPSRNWECFSRAFLSAGHFLKSWGNSIFLQPFPGQFLLFSLKVSKHSKQPTCPHGNTIGEKSKRFNQGNIPYKKPIKFWFNAIFEVIQDTSRVCNFTTYLLQQYVGITNQFLQNLS